MIFLNRRFEISYSKLFGFLRSDLFLQICHVDLRHAPKSLGFVALQVKKMQGFQVMNR